jgi:hypothetical protein
MDLVEQWADVFVQNFHGQKQNMEKYIRSLRALARTHVDDSSPADKVKTWTAFIEYDDYVRSGICDWHLAATRAPPGTMQWLDYWTLELPVIFRMFGVRQCSACGRPHLRKNCTVVESPMPVVPMVGPATATGPKSTAPICLRFNSAAGCLLDSCKFAHTCSSCGASHSAAAAHPATAAPATTAAPAATAAPKA